MIRIFVVITIIFLLVVFIWQLKRYLIRDEKESELDEVNLKGDLLDIEKEIAEENLRQKSVAESISELNNESKKGEESDD
ncbi:hypothetical protein [Teredinibacter franksiae]|uniref:hypothetical protein n=1 Tax=Teredinibacter franksiae TaxID=2761453 RepID=UPI00162A800D|nr:hypothetical protein [Teredinibacter franksiae]